MCDSVAAEIVTGANALAVTRRYITKSSNLSFEVYGRENRRMHNLSCVTRGLGLRLIAEEKRRDAQLHQQRVGLKREN